MHRLRLLVAAALVAGGISSVSAASAATLAPADGSIVTRLSSTAKVPVIVAFKSAPTNADVRSLTLAGLGGPLVRYSVVDAVAGLATKASLAKVRANPRVAFVANDSTMEYSLDRAAAAGRVTPVRDADYRSGGIDHVGGFTGDGVTVAVVDSGIDATHPDLRHAALAGPLGEEAVVIENVAMLGRSTVNEAANLLTVDTPAHAPFKTVDGIVEANTLAVPMLHSDTGGHGTHVAGTVAGRGVASDGKYLGVAPGASLVGVSIGEALTVARSIAGLDYVHQNRARLGIDIVTNSWGGGAAAHDDFAGTLVTMAAERLVADGLVVLFAAGNNGGDGSEVATTFNSNAPSVISVANYHDRTGDLDPSSSRGLKTNADTWPDLAAPGTEIISAAMHGGSITYVGTGQDALLSVLLDYGDEIVVPAPTPSTIETNVAGYDVVVGNYASMTGTSMATPFVAGVAALLLEANPALTPFEVRDILRATATLPAGKSYAADGFAFGKGLVDAAEAVAVALRMGDGDTLAQALGNAAVDFASSPARINMTPGPVTDQTIPLLPGAMPTITATPHVYHADAANPFVLTPNNQTVVAGEPVNLSARGITSNDSGVVLTLGSFSVTLELNGPTNVGPFATDEAVDGAAYRGDVAWTVPADLPGGVYEYVARVTVGSNTYTAFTSRITVVNG